MRFMINRRMNWRFRIDRSVLLWQEDLERPVAVHGAEYRLCRELRQINSASPDNVTDLSSFLKQHVVQRKREIVDDQYAGRAGVLVPLFFPDAKYRILYA